IKDPVQWGLYATGATKPGPWRMGLSLLPMASKLAPHPMKKGWGEFHNLPQRQGQAFREWWGGRERGDLGDGGERVNLTDRTDPTDQSEQTGSTAPTDPWLAFEQKLVLLGGRVAKMSELDLQGKVCYLDADVAEMSNLITTTDVWQADLGVTLADFAIAETGSIVLSSGHGRARLASLTPPTHIVLVKELVPTLEEAFTRIGNRTSVIITGTSRTADIEGVLVRGVHGPKELIVVRVD
ncbi:MAG: LUD domain-containing protein, partial [Chlorobia bacterium]|nr:LUD domain-containing protein [Fimbriimonadaceae bacterium]